MRIGGRDPAERSARSAVIGGALPVGRLRTNFRRDVVYSVTAAGRPYTCTVGADGIIVNFSPV